MVTRESATGGRCHSDPASTIQINKDHSSMVKFTRGDQLIPNITSKIREVCNLERDDQQIFTHVPPKLTLTKPEEGQGAVAYETDRNTPAANQHREVDRVTWNLGCELPSYR